MNLWPKKSKPQPTSIVTLSQYLSLFGEGEIGKERIKAALEKAWEIRSFEIELYWKRATYFWALLIATFAGYFVSMRSDSNLPPDAPIVLNCLGIMFSAGWYLANRGSKYWQLNWERHVDALEDSVTGPLYKTVVDPASLKGKLLAPHTFSVTKINTILSLFAFEMWMFFAVRSVSTLFNKVEPFKGFNMLILGVLTVGNLIALLWTGKTGPMRSEVAFVRRAMLENQQQFNARSLGIPPFIETRAFSMREKPDR